MKKYINKARRLGYVVFSDGSTQYLMFNQSIQSSKEVSKMTSTIMVIDEKPTKRSSKQDSNENIGVE